MNELKQAIVDEESEACIDTTAAHLFERQMRMKLSQKRREGRGGWYDREQCTDAQLWNLLVEHVKKAIPDGTPTELIDEAVDPRQLVDIANLAMFLYHRSVTLKANQENRDEAG